MNLLYVLPAPGGSGGANSVVQEACGLLRLGHSVRIAVDQKNMDAFTRNYASVPLVRHMLVPYASIKELDPEFDRNDVVVATVFPTVEPLVGMMNKRSSGRRHAKLAYYVQDYETLFVAPGTEAYETAKASYDFGNSVHAFAKTRWLCEVVHANHGAVVSQVLPSLDHDVYFPTGVLPAEPIHISAMVRAATPRRAPKRTMRMIAKLLDRYGSRIRVTIFGTPDEQLRASGLNTTGIRNLGHLTREQVAQLLRESHMFLDLSDYQAFGRTGLEAMACGCVPMLPVFGGAHEFAVDGENAFLVDTRSDDAILERVDQFIGMSARERRNMRISALSTAAEYSVHRASISILRFFESLM